MKSQNQQADSEGRLVAGKSGATIDRMAPSEKPSESTSVGRLLQVSCEISTSFLERVNDRPVARSVKYADLVNRFRVPIQEQGEDPLSVIWHLSEISDRGLVATPGPRYFGFVVGGAHPVSVAADWLAAAWDQNAFSFVLSPAGSAVEEVCRQWLLDLLGLPPTMTAGFTTGATMANFTGLGAARHAALRKLGWDVESRGLLGAPDLAVLTSEESHISIFGALQLLGLGRDRITKVSTDEQGRMRADELRRSLRQLRAPAIVCSQAGNVDTGSFDPLAEIAAIVQEHGSWLHVDGAFGLWAAASPQLRHLAAGVELADSIAIDCHKWLNVPQDSGVVFVRDQAAHRTAMTWNAPYFVRGPEDARDNHNFVPDASRRARGFAIYATLRTLGRSGLTSLIERCCALARRMAERLAEHPQVQILNDVVLNQVLVRFFPPTGIDSDDFTRKVIRAIQRDGTCWAGGTVWKGQHTLRISISNWSTTETDIDRSAEAILRCVCDVKQRLDVERLPSR